MDLDPGGMIRAPIVFDLQASLKPVANLPPERLALVERFERLPSDSSVPSEPLTSSEWVAGRHLAPAEPPSPQVPINMCVISHSLLRTMVI